MIGYKETSVNGNAKAKKTTKEVPTKVAAAASALGWLLGVTFAFLVEAAIVWVILAYLVKANIAFIQVFGAVLIFEQMLNRIKA